MSIRWLTLLPLAVIFIGVFFANRVEPILLGMPFLIFYMVMAIILTSIVMAIVYKLDPINKKGD